MATAGALPRPLMATISPGKTWLPLNVTIDANDRGDSPSSYRARALGTGDQEMSRCTAWMHAGWQPVAGTCSWAAALGSAWPVLRRWLGLTPERPALHL